MPALALVNQRWIAEIGKSQRLRLVTLLKRTQGLSVSAIARQLGMSYMGIKEQCVELEKLGYLGSARQPNPARRIGRPELIYTLTPKARELFPQSSDRLTLDLLNAAEALYGPTTPEKLLYRTFQEKADRYRPKLTGNSIAANLRILARLRSEEGSISEVHTDPLRLIDHHTPIGNLLAAYPELIARLEQEFFSRLLGVPVQRQSSTRGDLYLCTFTPLLP